MKESMTSSRQYLIRALYDWIVDNNCTPYILVNALADEVDVPRQFVKDGQIVLNVSPSAIVGFLVDNEAVSFNGRFGGVPTAIYVPVSAVMGI
ncbi:MAG: stringent starvation protein B, partial [Halieaceae bacterium]